MKNNSVKVHQERAEPWKVTLVDTGEDSMTGGRLKRIASFLKDEDLFCLTYGDGVCDLNITASIEYHKSHGKLATLTAVYPPGRFGALEIDGNIVTNFKEKPKGDGGLINGGFFVLSPKILSLLKNDESVWEKEPLAKLAASKELMSYEHDGFFQPMDTLKDRNYLEELWLSNKAPWKKWL
jgi:glucose-1-phosphate cytidylyltransferase